MAIRYKGNILTRLKEKGYSSARIRNDKIFGERTMQEFRTSGIVPNKTLDRLCRLLDCQPGELLEYTQDDDNANGE